MLITGIGVFTLFGNEVAERLIHKRAVGVGGNGSAHSGQHDIAKTQNAGES